mmetsp:Transcript_9021/g.20358  ORF Transcript_9021/g.20358 Transcript_9021/m.20358 type:complete len:491 (+) Transcript_9021:103-1575(+)|eukprot:CAMPEP_0172320262 /NCGR_PEP_ID=MMETSP1058-20130122/40122_1 /TAXON_ID=83371 /ORGANISM="Detonula confervacea, Strain CCMP 353" /LENGTH=490 /DNA_ID=CAMNT_0013035487 /DNA_START=83 /DNA_END=1555 /DNA_ORIENTATION=-
MIYDAVIIGGGVIGLSILRASLLAGYNTILIERNADLCDGASGRNSGVICTGVDAPSGSLERALIRDSISRVREFCIVHNVPMRECGSLVCLWPWDRDEDEDVEKSDDENKNSSRNTCLNNILHESHIAGDKDARFLPSETVARLEPSLSSLCRGAVHIPGEIVVDPWLFPLALASHSRELAKNSGRENDVIHTGREVVMDSSNFDTERRVWNIVTSGTTTDNNADKEDDTVTITARCVINAAGIDSDLVQLRASFMGGNSCTLPPPTFKARPRRGQYAIFAAPKEGAFTNDQGSEWPSVPRAIPIRPIQPVPSQFTKGIFVYSTLYDQIVVGPTAQDQSSRTDNTLDMEVARELAAHASRVLGSDFDDSKLVGEYVGIRPGTSKRDYQIHLHYPASFITVGGIRSTGLTASLGISRHVVQCLLPVIVPQPTEKSSPSLLLPPTPLPDVKELVDQYHKRGDGKIVVGGHVYKVTHSLTRMGWDARTGLAA